LWRAGGRFHHQAFLSGSAADQGQGPVPQERRGIAHQTKTPIASILLYNQLLKEQELTAEGHACAASLEEQAKKL